MKYAPQWAYQTSINPFVVVMLSGIFEVTFGILLLLGIFTRFSAGILGLHLLIIIQSLGYNEIMVRDIGLFMGLVAVFLHGKDKWCLDKKVKNKIKNKKLRTILYLGE